MSGVEAISMACNVMTIISFSLETIKLYRNIHEAGTPDPELAKNAEHIRKASSKVKRLLRKQQQLDPAQRAMTTDEEKRLRDIASECLQYSKAIQQEIASTSPTKPGILRALKSTMKTMWRKPYRDQLKGHLQASQSTMNTAVNVQILEQCIASGKLSREIYDKLDSEEKACEKLLKSLSYPRMNERKNSIPEKHNGSFEWVFKGLDSDEFSTPRCDSYNDCESGTTSLKSLSDEWLRRKKVAEAKRNQANANLLGWLQGERMGPFWVSGKPGSGKSTLVKSIMRDERTIDALRYWHPQPKIVAHFLWKPGTLLQQNFKGLLCSVLHQVLSIDAGNSTYLLQKTPSLGLKKDETDWDIKELKQYILETFHFSGHFFLVLLDGLDELFEPHRGINELFAFLDSLALERHVKLCISSRPEGVFQDRFSSYSLLRMQDVNYEDIFDYTLDFLNQLGLGSNHWMKQFITSEIMGKADGVFIWAHLALQNVKNGVQEFDEEWDDIYNRIRELPGGIMELYKEMWSRTGQKKDKYVKTAALYFQIMRWIPEHVNTIACLAVASDDTILENFTQRDKLPSPMRLVKACKHTHKTFFSISAGLLEADTSFWGLFPLQHGLSLLQQDDIHGQYRALEKWDSRAATVRFTHRTAIDFLDSDEGVELFGRHMKSYENIISRAMNALMILGCTPYNRETEQCGIPRIFGLLTSVQDRSKFSVQVYDLFRRFYRHSHMIDDFSKPPPSFTSHGFFMFAASYLGLYEYVMRLLQADEDIYVTTAAAALTGACEDYDYDNAEHISQRRRLIQIF
ncbi:hypothetical protein CGCSCA5_v000377 [Colletotrichum siamense]|nr:hypothetical protein CGCSCA5_v000377 [Colletotrichum siamense]